MVYVSKRNCFLKIFAIFFILFFGLSLSGCSVSDLVSHKALITAENSSTPVKNGALLYDKKEKMVSSNFFFKRKEHYFEVVGPGGIAENTQYKHALYKISNEEESEQNNNSVSQIYYIVQTTLFKNNKTSYHYSFLISVKNKIIHILPDKNIREKVQLVARKVGLDVSKNNDIELKTIKELLKYSKEFFSTNSGIEFKNNKSVVVFSVRTDIKQIIEELNSKMLQDEAELNQKVDEMTEKFTDKKETGGLKKNKNAICDLEKFNSSCLLSTDKESGINKETIKLLATLGDEKALIRYTLHELYSAIRDNKKSKINAVAEFIFAINKEFDHKDLKYISATYLKEKEDISTRVKSVSLNLFKSTYALLQGSLKISKNTDIYKNALEWLPRAHEKGSKEASHILGHLLIKNDPVKAANWFLEGDKLENPLSQMDVAGMFYDGDKIKKNEDAAIRIMRKAAKHGEALAQFKLGMYLRKKHRTTEDKKESEKWFGAALKQYKANSDSSLYSASQVAFMYKSGLGVKQDFKESARRYKKLVKKGYPWAHYHLALQYIEGDGVKVDYEEAKKHLKIASYKGVASADRIIKRLGW